MNLHLLHPFRRLERQFALLLACLTFGYILAIGLLSSDHFVGFEARYVANAENFVQGNFHLAHQANFADGPGYSLLLVPFVALDAPMWMPRMLNAFFLAGALWFFFQTAVRIVSRRWALVGTLILGLNPVLLSHLHHASTDIVSVFLSCGFVWALARVFDHARLSWKWILTAGGFLFLLIMFRVVFGYVATAALAGTLAFCLIRNARDHMWHAVAPLGCALALCLPYLAYTFHYSGQFPKWSMNNGEMAYWITSPYPMEWGNWADPDKLYENRQLAANHQPFFDYLNAMPPEEQAKYRKLTAITHFMEYPGATFRNLTANVSRILFGYPRSFQNESLATVFPMFTGMFLLLFGALAVYPTLRVWYQIPTFIKVYGLFGLAGFAFSAMLPAGPAQLLPLIPVTLMWMTFIYGRIVHVELAQTWQKDEGPVSHNCREWLDEAA